MKSDLDTAQEDLRKMTGEVWARLHARQILAELAIERLRSQTLADKLRNAARLAVSTQRCFEKIVVFLSSFARHGDGGALAERVSRAVADFYLDAGVDIKPESEIDHETLKRAEAEFAALELESEEN